MPPPLVRYRHVHDYRAHYERVYCHGPVTTFDGIAVRFRKQQFDHCFYETVSGPDDTFSSARAERIDWIRTALEDSSSDLYQGWDNQRKRISKSRRVAIVYENYVVIIRMIGGRRAAFVTAFVATERTLRLIRSSPKWT